MPHGGTSGGWKGRRWGVVASDGSGCTHVAPESTGVAWQPIRHLPEGRFELRPANAQRIERVPGRQADVPDAVGIADRRRHGRPSASYVPDRAQRELTRYRPALVRERSRAVPRVQKTLAGASVKRGSA